MSDNLIKAKKKIEELLHNYHVTIAVNGRGAFILQEHNPEWEKDSSGVPYYLESGEIENVPF